MTYKQSLGLILTGALILMSFPAMAGPGKLDLDRDGKISMAEMLKGVDQRFAKLDSNKDGQISQAEFQAQRQKRRRTQMAQKRFARIDTDGNGQVSLAEMKAAAQQRFRKQDANQDGFISADERKQRKGRRGQRRQRQAS